jgi:hypothetical protein
MTQWANELTEHFKRKKSKWPKIHDETPNIPGNKGNANQNGMNTIKSTNNKKVGKDMGEKEPSYTVFVNVDWQNHYGKHFGGFSKN